MVELEDNDASFERRQLWCVTISVFTTVQIGRARLGLD